VNWVAESLTSLEPSTPASLTGLAMAFKLIESALAQYHAVSTPHLVALVRCVRRLVTGAAPHLDG
jgi:hypothetical protein